MEYDRDSRNISTLGLCLDMARIAVHFHRGSLVFSINSAGPIGLSMINKKIPDSFLILNTDISLRWITDITYKS